jgi:hypothetical protein
MGFLLMALTAAAATNGPIAFKSLAALSFKAFLVAKVALVLSSLLTLKKLVLHIAHDRSFSLTENVTERAHKMANSAQLQRAITAT